MAAAQLRAPLYEDKVVDFLFAQGRDQRAHRDPRRARGRPRERGRPCPRSRLRPRPCRTRQGQGQEGRAEGQGQGCELPRPSRSRPSPPRAKPCEEPVEKASAKPKPAKPVKDAAASQGSRSQGGQGRSQAGRRQEGAGEEAGQEGLSEREIVCDGPEPRARRSARRQGFRLDVIYPADDPHTAILTRGRRQVRLTSRRTRRRCPTGLPSFRPEFVLTRAGDTAGEGRAGMLYRDLIPGRLGGRYIASHITIPEGGPVADWVHYHRIALQLISSAAAGCASSTRTRASRSSCTPATWSCSRPGSATACSKARRAWKWSRSAAPALHETFADHELELAERPSNPARIFGGQRFLRHVAADTPWTPFNGGEAQETAHARRDGRPGGGRALSGRQRRRSLFAAARRRAGVRLRPRWLGDARLSAACTSSRRPTHSSSRPVQPWTLDEHRPTSACCTSRPHGWTSLSPTRSPL